MPLFLKDNLGSSTLLVDMFLFLFSLSTSKCIIVLCVRQGGVMKASTPKDSQCPSHVQLSNPITFHASQGGWRVTREPYLPPCSRCHDMFLRPTLLVLRSHLQPLRLCVFIQTLVWAQVLAYKGPHQPWYGTVCLLRLPILTAGSAPSPRLPVNCAFPSSLLCVLVVSLQRVT